MLVAIVLPHCGNCFKLLVAQHVMGVLQMVSYVGYCVLKRTIGVARCGVQHIGVDVQQSLEFNGRCCSGQCLLQCCDMLVVMVLQLGLVSFYSIDDAASMLLAAQLCTGRALVDTLSSGSVLHSIIAKWLVWLLVRADECMRV
jgi:hypothetical protein